MLIQPLLGLFLGCLIAYLAFCARALNLSGAMAAAVLGAVIFGLGGFSWAVLLMAFFISSSVLSRLFRQPKLALAEKYSKGSRRDAGQVLANGGVAGLLVLLAWMARQAPAVFPGQTGEILWLAYAASLAAANADTWATELGVLNSRPPILITTGQPVERGTSGGISLTGTLAALGGAVLIAALTATMSGWGWAPGGSGTAGLALLLVAMSGLAGSLVDSLLGATIQAIYTCPACLKETERHPLHSCGTPTILKRGLAWFDNDWVNLTCTMAAALITMAISAALLPPVH